MQLCISYHMHLPTKQPSILLSCSLCSSSSLSCFCFLGLGNSSGSTSLLHFCMLCGVAEPVFLCAAADAPCGAVVAWLEDFLYSPVFLSKQGATCMSRIPVNSFAVLTFLNFLEKRDFSQEKSFRDFGLGSPPIKVN